MLLFYLTVHFNTQNISYPGTPNSYQQAIQAVGNVLEPYDTDKLYPVYGFGAKVWTSVLFAVFAMFAMFAVFAVLAVLAVFAAFAVCPCFTYAIMI